ncbi:MAG: KH domain-containing protein [Clostridiales bacterium]|nr:KH domain-containing protein [Clostridiales bacterium]
MIEVIKEFIDGIIEKLNLQCEANIEETDEEFKVTLAGPDAHVLIGYRGDVLDSIQYLTLLLINKHGESNKRLVIDGENYRAKREATLSKLAKNLAFQVSKSGRPKQLEPMNPFERRIIHSALANDKYVTTESEGEEPNRYVVIKPVKKSSTQRVERQERPQNTSTVTGINRYAGKMKSFGGEKRRYF